MVRIASSKTRALGDLRSRVCEAGAQLLLSEGVDALTVDTMVSAVATTRGRFLRAYPARADVVSGIYSYGHQRVTAVCDRHPRRGASGIDSVIDLSYDLLEQAATDPVARVVHSLESTAYAADTGLGSVYLLWRTRFTGMLTSGMTPSPGSVLGGTAHQRVLEVVDVLVAALAGFCDPRRIPPGGSDCGALFDRLHLVLTAVLPAVCTDDSHGEYVRQYLLRVHHFARAMDSTPVSVDVAERVRSVRP